MVLPNVQELQAAEDAFNTKLSSFEHALQEASVYKEESAAQKNEVCVGSLLLRILN